MRLLNDYLYAMSMSAFTVAIIFLGFLLIAALVGTDLVERKEWEVFKIANDCRKVEVKRFRPGENTAWKCDNGVTYWR